MYFHQVAVVLAGLMILLINAFLTLILKEVNRMKSQDRKMLQNKQLNHELQLMCDEFKRMIKTEEGALFFIDMMHLWLDRKKSSDTEK